MVFIAYPALPTVAVVKSLQQICTAAREDDPIRPLLWTRTASAETASAETASSETLSTETTSAETTSAETVPEETASNGEDDRSYEEEAIAVEMGYVANPDSHYLLVTDTDTAQDIAYVGWRHSKSRTDAKWAEMHANRYRPPEMNSELMDATSGACYLKRAKILKDSEAFVLLELYVRPEYQRRGIGGDLVEWGLKKADELEIVAYTEASAEGLGLYLKHGFREVDRVTVDLGDWGGEKGQLHSMGLLVRPVRGKE
ncbi:hypothetical protein MMC17_002707 [Xylographa soralifera]|nr:hypothetical protein [Xylographa soralifera]